MVTPAQRREAVAHLQSAHQMSERRACRIAGVERALVRYRAIKGDDGELRARLRALAHERRRFGYRRLHVLLRREGWAVNKKRVQRIYREERLMVRKRGGRKRALGICGEGALLSAIRRQPASSSLGVDRPDFAVSSRSVQRW